MKKKDLEIIDKIKDLRIFLKSFFIGNYLVLNLLNIFAAINIIASLFLMACFFPIALPPTVSDEIIELTSSVMITVDKLNFIDILIASIAPREPLTIPHISPMTSLHILAIVLEFFIK